MTDDNLISKIKTDLNIICPDIADINVLDFCILETIDRIKLYLNIDTIPDALTHVISPIISNSFVRFKKNISLSGEPEHIVTSVSDNGQAISFSNELVKYFANSTDNDLFTGYSAILSRYRRIKVVNTKYNE